MSVARVAGTTAYLLSDGLQIVDLSVPSSPTVLGQLALSGGQLMDLAVSGNYAYVADCGAGVRIVDVSNPATPVEVGSYDLGGAFSCARGVSVDGNYACIAYAEDGLVIVDVSNPALPAWTATYSGSTYVTAVTAAGGYAYVSEGTNRLEIVDLSNPSAPVAVGQYATNLYDPRRSFVDGSYLYLVNDNGTKGLWVFDIGDPASPNLAAMTGMSSPKEAARLGTYVLVADAGNGLLVVEDSPPWCAAACGNGTIEYPETCDDGNHQSGDGCNPTCSGM